MSEWSKVLDSKSSVQQCTVGSNPTLSASKFKASRRFAFGSLCLLLFIFDSLFDILEFIGRISLHT